MLECKIFSKNEITLILEDKLNRSPQPIGRMHICVLSPFLGKKGIFLMVETLDLANLDLLRVSSDGLKAPPENNTRILRLACPNLL